jgi:membrane protein implicated in regulation of membrane protease activity
METTELSNILILWICAGMVLVVAEALTAAFYALSMAVAAFLVAIYVAVSGETDFSIVQGAIFALASVLFAIFFPRWFQRSVPDKKQGVAAYEGRTFALKLVYGQYKIEIDGVDYMVSPESVTPSFAEGRTVRLDSVDAGSFHVSLV